MDYGRSHENKDAPRPYRQVARAAATEETRRRIVAAFADALRARWLDEITLDDVARTAGTTRQTVIRLCGGKEELLRAAAEVFKQEIDQRRAVPDGASPAAVAQAVTQDYEAMGDIVFRLLAQELRHPVLTPLLTVGRRSHRAWVEESLAAHLPQARGARRERLIAEAVAATDVYVWKLLRRDMGLSARAVAGAVAHMLESLLREENTP
ncbi:MAG: TetR/AcrR family transcriptional regulator [Proteobacteria bacterium]|nr:TetR/AcrR family transcriptional regulator [Pseudomonadota bacterium]